MEQIKEYLPFIIPILIVQYGLMIAALVHILRHKNYRIGNRVVWIVISVVVNTIGPILYFTIGKGEE
nr:PLDc N-terminal domain-containing protein [Clostridium sp. KNHs205]